MSEEILKALMQLFAIIAKQDGGVRENEVAYVDRFLKEQLNDEAVVEYMRLFKEHADLSEAAQEKQRKKEEKGKKRKLTSVKDSVRILGICKKINKQLNQGQKVVVLVRLFELINADRKFTEQRMAIINTVADVFNIAQEEFSSIEKFVIESEPANLDQSDILVINKDEQVCDNCKHIQSEPIDGTLFILRVKSVELYFLKYTGNQDIILNGLILNNKRIYLFANGSSLKLPLGKPVYYSDVVGRFLEDVTTTKISFNVNHLTYQFDDENYGVRDINISETHGKLVGIMGASGAGKTTLLNILAGIYKPTSGQVLVNGIDMHEQSEQLKGALGYIPQDDLLIEELTVFQNLFFSAKQSFNNKDDEAITELVLKTLRNLGLYEIRNLRVGSPLNKFISGGQRKRLNIALELIREPSILFVDEPTSGLSSRDSENVMDLLSELALKGKLIFVVIHQPSSDIYKMFDDMVILDIGGYMVWYGNPVEALVYFKKMDAQINSEVGECPTCGNVNPELIFNILEARVLDEFGQYTHIRKTTPKRWEELFRENVELEFHKDIDEEPPSNLDIPAWIKQFNIYTTRDFLKKISNTQYLILTLSEAPILGFILSYIIRYVSNPETGVYIFRENENLPPYIFMSIVVALFLGMTVSAEEIFRDRKILNRERFLNLSRSSYLTSKVIILVLISAIQSILYVAIGNTVLGITGMYFEYWYTMFVISVFANMLGLNISASFNSPVTIYILIPLLMIPQMALGGAMFPFDKLNRNLGDLDKVPIIAEIMASRWAYEGLIVHQFKDNKYEERFYELDKQISYADFKIVHHLPEMNKYIDNTLSVTQADSISEEEKDQLEEDMELLRYEFENLQYRTGKTFGFVNKFTPDTYNKSLADTARGYLNSMEKYFQQQSSKASNKRNRIITYLTKTKPKVFQQTKKDYHNEKVADIVRNILEPNKIIRVNNKLVQRKDPIFLDPDDRQHFTFRTHFMAPRKHFLGTFFATFYFDMFIIWVMTLLLYITVYYDLLRKAIEFFGDLKFKRS